MRIKGSKVGSASHASLTNINCKQHSNESLTSFIYRWGELLLPSCGTTTEQCRGKIKKSLNEKKAKRVIRKHLKIMPHTFYIAKEEEKELLIIDDNRYFLKENTNSIVKFKSTPPKWCSIHNCKSHNTVECTICIKCLKL